MAAGSLNAFVSQAWHSIQSDLALTPVLNWEVVIALIASQLHAPSCDGVQNPCPSSSTLAFQRAGLFCESLCESLCERHFTTIVPTLLSFVMLWFRIRHVALTSACMHACMHAHFKFHADSKFGRQLIMKHFKPCSCCLLHVKSFFRHLALDPMSFGFGMPIVHPNKCVHLRAFGSNESNLIVVAWRFLRNRLTILVHITFLRMRGWGHTSNTLRYQF